MDRADPAQIERIVACRNCDGEPEPGWIETLNNGPIVPCPICNPDGHHLAEQSKGEGR